MQHTRNSNTEPIRFHPPDRRRSGLHPKALSLTPDVTQIARSLSHPVSHWASSLFLPDATDAKPTKDFASVLRRLRQEESSPRRPPLRRFEVVNRPHNIDDVDRVGDGADDVLDGLVGVRRLVDGALVHRGRIDALHGGPVLAQVERFPCLAARHDAARAVGRRVVPRLVAVPCVPSIVNMAILPAPWRLLGV